MERPDLEQLISALESGADPAAGEDAGGDAVRGGELRAVDIAEALTHADNDTARVIVSLLDDERAAEALISTDDHTRAAVTAALDVDHLTRIVEELDPDDAADVLPLIDDERRPTVLAGLDPEFRAAVARLSGYAPDSAGGIMTTEVFSVDAAATCAQALAKIGEAEQPETISRLYVTDAAFRLVGVVSLKDLLTSRHDRRVGEIMDADVISVRVDEDQEESARLADRYHLASLPVVDHQRRLIGLITVDDIMDVLEEEASEDMMLLAGTNVSHPTTEPIASRLRARAPWLTVTLLGTFLAGLLLEAIEAAFFPSQLDDAMQRLLGASAESPRAVANAHAFKMLMYYIPLIGGMAGNVGSQSSTIMVRGFATGEVDPTKPGRVLRGEMLLALLIGLGAGLLVGALVSATHPDYPVLGLIVGAALPCAIVAAALAGTLIPFACQAVRVDPAYAGGPFLLTLNDLAAYTIYFAVAVGLIDWLGTFGVNPTP